MTRTPQDAYTPGPEEQMLRRRRTLSDTITVEMYASICAELGSERDRARVAAVYAKYGIPDQETMHRLDRLWQAKFADDPKLLDAWQRAYRCNKRI